MEQVAITRQTVGPGSQILFERYHRSIGISAQS